MAKSDTNRAVANARHAEQGVWLWRLQLQGFTYSQMRELTKLPTSEGGLGVELSEATISRRLVEHGEKKVELIDELRTSWQAIELERLEAIHGRWLRIATDAAASGDVRAEAIALDALLKVGHERRAFMGTNAVAKTETTVTLVSNDDLALDELLIAREADNVMREAAR